MPTPQPVWTRRGFTILSLALGLAMLAFGKILQASGCLSCSTGIPPAAVMMGGLAWLAIGTLAALDKAGLSAGTAVLMCSIHAGLILFARGRACAPCLAFASAEALTTLVGLGFLQKVSQRNWLALSGWALLLALAGLSGSAVGLQVLRPVMPTRTLGSETRRLDDPRTTVLYLVVHVGCAACDRANERLVRALEGGLPVRALITDEHSELGEGLINRHRLIKTPAFVAMRGSRVLGVQDGGTMEEFLATLERQGVW